MSSTQIPRSSLQVEVTNRLRAEIVEGHWRPGLRLQERLLCDRYGISRSPLREAFQTLAADGLIEISPNRGVIVSAPTPALIMQNFELLRALELLAVDLVCKHAEAKQIEDIVAADEEMNECARTSDLQGFFRKNNEVHRRLVLASGNEPLADAHLITSRQIIRVQNLNGPLEHMASEGVGEHDGIIVALRARNATKARKLFGAHLQTVEDNLRARLRQWASAE